MESSRPGEREGEDGIRFSLRELAGSVGDFGTIFPIILGAGIAAQVNVSYAFLGVGLWFIIAGFYYKLPIPIEPMKAIGAIAIAEGLTAGEIAASGIIIGILFLAFGMVKGMERIRRVIPESVIRGIQVGLALLLLRTSLGYIVADIFFAALAIGIVVIFFLGATWRKIPDISSLVVIGIGLAAGIIMTGMPPLRMIPIPELIIPLSGDWLFATIHLVIPQIPLTLGNAILATSLLTLDLFRHEVKPDRLAKTTGIMNLITAPLGGFPMCHGAGGLAAMYRFGARTGGANIIAGLIIIGFAVAFAPPEVLTLIPYGIFGGLLVFVALELGKHGIQTDSYPVTIFIGIITLISGITPAFILGMILAYILGKQKSEDDAAKG
ncbi:MAG: sulfate transporter [Methanocalculus sp. MSAO_Arc1]|uniref:putative sulfate/molybdate transporter n=1 Tax=Methanocalculus TaxID=71151 RepID=UPI000FF635A0|nr:MULTISPECIES: putative sulfate/molybdate transporter [unclassified Methanocalculus]MCP1662294.1 MFS superfamily sulfate permease-like transporter [Methanocalculus sp. AMF5]RQD80945.1 MAG: sulfate transporter [Methanocalculus sp. MSAO_Arc1]